MSELEKVKKAFMKAHKAGDTKNAAILAKRVKELQSSNEENSVKIDDSMPDHSFWDNPNDSGPASSMQKLMEPFMNNDGREQDNNVRAEMEVTKMRPSQAGNVGAMSRGINSGMLFGFDDEISAAIAAPFRAVREGTSVSEAYDRSKAFNDALKRRDQEENTVANTVGNVAGAIGQGGAAAKAGATLMGRSVPFLNNTGKAAVEAGVYSAAHGAGNAEEGERLDEALKSGVIGAVAGGVADKAVRGVSNVVANKMAGRGKSSQELGEAASKLYDQADVENGKITKSAVNRLKFNLETRMKSHRVSNYKQPETTAMLEDVQNTLSKGEELNVMDLEDLRQSAQMALRKAENSTDRSAASKVIEEIDKVIDDASSFVKMDPAGLDSIKQARKKTELSHRVASLEKIRENSKYESDPEQYIIKELRKIAQDPKKLGAFTAEEQKHIKDMISKFSGAAAARVIGKVFTPTSLVGGGLASGAAIGTGVAGSGSLLPVAAVGAAGYGIRQGSRAYTKGALNNLINGVGRENIINRNTVQFPNKVMPSISALIANQQGQ